LIIIFSSEVIEEEEYQPQEDKTDLVHIDNKYPVPVIKLDEQTIAHRYDEITFSGIGSCDIDGTINGYLWDFGDGTQSNNIIVKHNYTELGDYIVYLWVTDDKGAKNFTSVNLTIRNIPPFAHFYFTYDNYEFYTYEECYFRAKDIYAHIRIDDLTDFLIISQGSYDPDGEIVNYTWDFGNGDIEYGVKVYNYFRDNGNFNITLTVWDNDGANASTVQRVTILNRAPSPCIGDRLAPWPNPPEDYLKPLEANKTFDYNSIYFVQPFTNFTFTETSRDIDGQIVLYEWDFDGDNITDYMSVDNGNSTYRFEEIGVFRCGLTVTDDDGARTTVRLIFIVSDNLSFIPQINFTTCKEFDGSPFADPMISASFNAQFLSPSPDDFELDYGDGNQTSNPNSWHNFPIGRYEINLKATSGSETIELAIILNVD
jgi:PKD repeat protein